MKVLRIVNGYFIDKFGIYVIKLRFGDIFISYRTLPGKKFRPTVRVTMPESTIV